MNYYTISQLVTTPNPQWLPVRHLETREEAVTELDELRQENPGTIFELDDPTS